MRCLLWAVLAMVSLYSLAGCRYNVAAEPCCGHLGSSLVHLILDDPNLPSSYRRYVEAGHRHMLAGNWVAAAKAFEAALGEPLHEIPNYEVVVFLARAKCLAGDAATGLSLLLDFECMLDVELGVQHCFLPTHDAHLRPNPGLTPMCFNVMCSEIFLSYYANPTPETRERVSHFRNEAVKVRELCRRCAALPSGNAPVESPR